MGGFLCAVRGPEKPRRGRVRAFRRLDGGRTTVSVDFRSVKDGVDAGTNGRPAERAELGLSFTRMYTRAGADPLAGVEHELRDSVITNPDGSIVFELRG